MRLGIFAAALLLAAGAAQAQTVTPEVQRRLAAFSDSEEFAALRRVQQQRVIGSLGETCAGQVQMRRVSITLLAPIGFDDGGKVQSGGWKEQHEITGCQYTKQANFVVGAAAGRPIQIVPLLPGTSAANTRLQMDVLVGVLSVASAVRRDPDCKKPIIADTAFNGWTGEAVPDALHGPAARPWQESWTIYLCGRVVDVIVQFTPDKNGTGYNVPAKDAHLRP